MLKKILIFLLVVLTWIVLALGVKNIIESTDPIQAIYLYVFMFLYIVVLAITFIGLKYIFHSNSP